MVTLDPRLHRPSAEIAVADSGGDGIPVLLTHGAGMDHTMYVEQAAALTAEGYRVIVWDLRGHGASTLAGDVRFTAADALEDLEALLDECGSREAVLVGHSLGGNLVQTFAREHPERVRGLIVLDATWNTGPLSAHERFALHLAAPILALIPAGRLPRSMARASAVTDEAITRTEAVFARMPKSRFLDVWRAAVSTVDPDPGYRSPVPLALVRGAEERTGNIAAAMPRWAETEDITEHVIPGAGHIVTWDAPERTTRVLLEILECWKTEHAQRDARP